MNEFILLTTINDVAARLENYLKSKQSKITDEYCQNQINHINEIYEALLIKNKSGHSNK